MLASQPNQTTGGLSNLLELRLEYEEPEAKLASSNLALTFRRT